jgi:hypothetical protein
MVAIHVELMRDPIPKLITLLLTDPRVLVGCLSISGGEALRIGL